MSASAQAISSTRKAIATGKRRRLGRRALIVVLRFALIVAVLWQWERVGNSSAYWELVIGTPTAVLDVLRTWVIQAFWWQDLAVTLKEATLGYLLGVLMAVGLASFTAPFPAMDRFLGPFVAALNALPKVVLAPVFILWFGIDLASKVYFVAACLFFIVYYGIETGLKGIDQTLPRNAKLLGASRFQMLRAVYVPAVVTWLFAGLRISAATSLLAAVIAEYLGASRGIGHRIAASASVLDSASVIAGITVVATVAVIADRTLVRVERRLSRWRLF